MAQLAALLGDKATAASAAARAEKLHTTIEHEYYRPASDSYAFSRDAGGKLDTTATVYPSVAWWNGGAGLDHPQASLRHWASYDFDTDWGVRDIAESDPLYDPISYHQGSVWPLFTGWTALAEYRGGHPLAGYQTAMQNADLTTAQDLGAVTELLSGAFFEPFGRSTSHQLWSSAMVVIPVMRGIFGISVDAPQHTVKVEPHLPASWPSADVLHFRAGESVVNLHYKREGAAMAVSLETVSGPAVRFDDNKTSMHVPLPAFEVSIPHGLPLRGARTAQLKVVDEVTTAHSLHLEIEGIAGSDATLTLRRNGPATLKPVEGATLTDDELHIHFPAGQGYVTQAVTLSW